MPRVYTKTKSKQGKEYTCERCRKVIEPGTRYHEWSFRFGGTHRQCAACGTPRASQLTQSKMSGVYAAVEDAGDTVDSATTIEEVKDALDAAADEVESVSDEYQSSLDNMPDGLQQGPTGEEIQEKIDALTEFVDNLRSVDLPDEGETEDEKDDVLEEAKSSAQTALDELSI